jgi:hypothetical protein
MTPARAGTTTDWRNAVVTAPRAIAVVRVNDIERAFLLSDDRCRCGDALG